MLVQRLYARGVLLLAGDSKILVQTAKPLTEKQRQFLKLHKLEIIAELRTPNTRLRSIE